MDPPSRFKADENLPRSLVSLLRASGYDAVSAAEQGLAGAADSTLAAVCGSEARALLTFDLDFADIRRYPPEQFAGIVVLRLRRQDADHVGAVAKRLLPMLATERLAGRLWVVDEDGIRVRGGD